MLILQWGTLNRPKRSSNWLCLPTKTCLTKRKSLEDQDFPSPPPPPWGASQKWHLKNFGIFFTLTVAVSLKQLLRTVVCFWDDPLPLNANVNYGWSLTMGSPLHSRDGGRWERRREEGWSSDDSAAEESRHCHCQWHAYWEENHSRTQRNSTLHGLPLRLLTSFY